MSQETYRLRVVRLDGVEIEVIGNRAGLKDLADVCQGLTELSVDEAKTPTNYMNNAEDGSLELIIRYDPNSNLKAEL